MTSIHSTQQASIGSQGELQAVHFTAPRSHRFLFLDALRGIAALFVVLFHFPKVMTSSLASNGQLAVDFFFCLSGFVVAFSYEERLNHKLSFKDFTVVRAIRLYPIYAIGSLIGLLVAMAVDHFVDHSIAWSSLLPLFALSLFMWPTRLSPMNLSENYPLDLPAWSLFYEVVANLVYALLVKLKLARNAVLLAIVIGSLTALIARVASGASLDVGPRQADFVLGFARVAFSFFLGVLLCRLHRSQTHDVASGLTQWLFPLIITLVLIAILISPFLWMRTELFRLIAISLCLPAMVYTGGVARLPHSFAPLCSVLGELSYPLYLLHISIVTLMRARHVQHFSALHTSLAHGIVLCTEMILAAASFWVGKYIDLPIRRSLTRRYNNFKSQQAHA